MSPHVLARKYRPQRFDEVVGQAHVIKAIRHGIIKNQLHHAYLLTGTRGVGKTTLARILAKAANCLNNKSGDEASRDGEPCGKCAHCQAIEQGAFPDLLEIDAASNTGVDDMRALLDTVVYPPINGGHKVYVIDEVHMLSKNAFNAMLKTLEEPPSYLTFVLATTDPQHVPITVLSRCLQFNLKALPESLLADHFSEVLRKEAIDFEANALPILARYADGSVRDGLSLLDQLIAQGGGTLKTDLVHSLLGVVGRDWALDLLKAVIEGNTATVLDKAEALSAQSLSFDDVLSDMGRALLNLQIVQLGGAPTQTVSAEEQVTINTLAGKIEAESLQLMYQILLHGRRDLPYAPDNKSGFVMTLLRLMAFIPTTAPTTMLARTGQAPPLNTKVTVSNPAALAAPPPSAPINDSIVVEVIKSAAPPSEPIEPTTPPAPTDAIIPQPTQPESDRDDLGLLAEVDWPSFIREHSPRLPAQTRRLAMYCAPHSIRSVPTDDGLEQVLTLDIAATEKHQIESTIGGLFIKSLAHLLQDLYQYSFMVSIRVLHEDEGKSGLPAASLAFANLQTAQALEKAAKSVIVQDPIWQTLKSYGKLSIVHQEIRRRH